MFSSSRRAFHVSATLNLAKRRLCDALGTSRGRAASCCAISIARVRAALAATTMPRSNRPLARRVNFGAAKSCSRVIFMVALRRPKTHTVTASRGSYGRITLGATSRAARVRKSERAAADGTTRLLPQP